MTEFSDEQLKQFQFLLAPFSTRLSTVALSDVDTGVWETTARQSFQHQSSHSLSKQFAVVSLQDLAKLVFRSTGWQSGSDTVQRAKLLQ